MSGDLTYESLRSLSTKVYESAQVPMRSSKQVHHCSAWELIQLGLQRLCDDAGLNWPWQWRRSDGETVFLVDSRHTGIIANPGLTRDLFKWTP